MPATPNFIIAGVNKAGTTSLFTYLAQHPAVCASDIKETGYFLTYRYAEPARPWAGYLNHFRACSGSSIIMEATPGYFYGGRRVAEAIYQRLGAIRIAILLRDPVERCISFYKSQQTLLRLPASMTLASYVAACDAVPTEERWRREQNVFWGIEGGYYARYLPAWFDIFGAGLRVFFFSQLRQDPGTFLTTMAGWLELDPGPFGQLVLSVENRSMNYRVRWLQQLALAFNRGGESFWRRNPGLKQRLRAVYLRINGQPFEQFTDNSTIQQLRQRYAVSNADLGQQLRARGYLDLPDWIGSPHSLPTASSDSQESREPGQIA